MLVCAWCAKVLRGAVPLRAILGKSVKLPRAIFDFEDRRLEATSQSDPGESLGFRCACADPDRHHHTTATHDGTTSPPREAHVAHHTQYQVYITSATRDRHLPPQHSYQYPHLGVGYYRVGWSVLGYVGYFGAPISFRAASVSARTAPSSAKIC